MSAMGTKFAPATGSNAVTQFDKGSNVKFRANRLRSRLALDGQLRALDVVARYLPLGKQASEPVPN